MDIWLIILISLGGVGYFFGGVLYIINVGCGEDFLCRLYKNVTTKGGFVIFLMIDIIMFPWTLMCCLSGGIILLFEMIIFGRKN